MMNDMSPINDPIFLYSMRRSPKLITVCSFWFACAALFRGFLCYAKKFQKEITNNRWKKSEKKWHGILHAQHKVNGHKRIKFHSCSTHLNKSVSINLLHLNFSVLYYVFIDFLGFRCITSTFISLKTSGTNSAWTSMDDWCCLSNCLMIFFSFLSPIEALAIDIVRIGN